MFAVLARMFELGKRPFLLHAPIVGKSLTKMAELLFGSAFRDLVAPGKLLPLDAIVLCASGLSSSPIPPQHDTLSNEQAPSYTHDVPLRKLCGSTPLVPAWY